MEGWDLQRAAALVTAHLHTVNMVKHSWAVEAGMRRMAEHLGEDADRWALTGLLHDLDYEMTKDDFPRHGIVSGEILRKEGFADGAVLAAIIEHTGNTPAESRMGRALYAVDPATGFIVACALMHPEKKVAVVPPDFMVKRFAEKRFAQGASRDQMRKAEEWFGLPVAEFLTLVRDGMAVRAAEIGL